MCVQWTPHRCVAMDTTCVFQRICVEACVVQTHVVYVVKGDEHLGTQGACVRVGAVCEHPHMRVPVMDTVPGCARGGQL